MAMVDDLARLQHWWWAQLQAGEPFPPLAVDERRRYWWRDGSQPAIRTVMDECEAGLDEERDYRAPCAALYERYHNWAMREGAAEDRAADFASDLLFGWDTRLVARHGAGGRAQVEGTLVGGYHQNPHWAPLATEMLRGRLWRPSQSEVREVVSGFLSDQDDTEDGGGHRRVQAVAGDDDPPPAPARMRRTPVPLGPRRRRVPPRRGSPQENRFLRREADELTRQRQLACGPLWHGLLQTALAELSPSDREQVDRWGPWDRCSYLPGADTRTHLSVAERQAKSRARRRFADALAEAAGFANIVEFAQVLTRYPQGDSLQDVMVSERHVAPDILRQVLAGGGDVPRQAQAKACRDMIRVACEISWYLPGGPDSGETAAR